MEDVGTQYYNELKGRSLIQGNDRMHDQIYSLACIMAEKFFYRVNYKESHSYKALASSRHLFPLMEKIFLAHIRSQQVSTS